MKNKLILLLFLAAIGLPFGGFTQEYVPFVDTIKDWNVTNTSYSYGGSVATINTMKLHISSSDTIINDTAYYKLINTGQYNFFLPEGIIGFIREDTAGRKVYFRESTYTFYEPKDRLLYDFSLEQGDTTEIFGLHHCLTHSNAYRVSSTGTITLLNGEERKTWQLIPLAENPVEADEWIEGIGSLNGLIFPGCYELSTISISFNLLCYYEDEVNLYLSTGDTCFIDYTTGLEANLNSKIKLYPNPAKDFLFLEFDEKADNCKHYTVFSADGLKILEGKSCNEKVSIPVSHLRNGIYHINIFNQFYAINKTFIKTD